MTGALHEAAARAARTGVLPLLPAERLLAIERVAARIETRAPRRAGGDVATLDTATLRRDWPDGDLIARALAADRRSIDRAIVIAYLLDYPLRHPRFAVLAAAAATAAERHDWQWRDAGRRWRLWEGTETIRGAPSRAAALREAGIVGPLAGGAFARAVRRR